MKQSAMIHVPKHLTGWKEQLPAIITGSCFSKATANNQVYPPSDLYNNRVQRLIIVSCLISKKPQTLAILRDCGFTMCSGFLLLTYFSQISIHLPSGSAIQTNVPNSLFSGSLTIFTPCFLKCSIQAAIFST